MLDLRHHGIKSVDHHAGLRSYSFQQPYPSPADAWKIQPEDFYQMVVDLLRMNPRTLPSKVEVRRHSRPGVDCLSNKATCYLILIIVSARSGATACPRKKWDVPQEIPPIGT